MTTAPPAPHEVETLGGRDHVRRYDAPERAVVWKGVRRSVGLQRRDLFLEASLQHQAGQLIGDGGGGPVLPPLECTPHRLTTVMVEGAITADRLFDEPDELLRQCALVGGVLGDLHREGRTRADLLPVAMVEDPPLEPVPYDQVVDHPVAALELVAAVHARGLHEHLVTGPVPGTPVTFLHGDFTFDNVLLRPGRGPIVIDWECAGHGPAATDVGAHCASLLSEGVRLGAVEAEHGTSRGLRRLDETTSVAWRAIATFLTAYRNSLADDDQLAALTPPHLVRACARSLLARAAGYTDLVGSYDRLSRTLVQVVTNMAVRPSLFHGRFS